jgi:energy-coupling factor transporter ATP-binding protein EcfA2
MKAHLCWSPAAVTSVINPEAEEVPPSIFKAVHTPSELRVAIPIGKRFQDLSPDHYGPMSQEQLLEEFLHPNAPYRRLAVFGRSGSGKSHLIHWLKLQIPSNETRRVVVVPKAGTSLRSILQMLIDELPPEKQVPFQEALSRTGEAIATRKGQKERLLNEIAYALSEAKPAEGSPDPELESELIKVLPYLFQDVHFREKHFHREDNIVAELVDHVFAAPSAYRPAEQRRQFTLGDLPVDPLDFKDASAQAQGALRTLHGIPDAPKIAVDLVNNCLEVAIGRTLSFSGDRLVGLMDELRAHLATQGRELVLLIEDFARVQGLDRALLQAMIDQGSGTKKLCKLRWAIGVTTGFFEQVVDTLYMRISHFVDMDRSAGRRGADRVDRIALAEFAGPYLNANRLGPQALLDWDQHRPDERLANACIGCIHHDICHETFGATSQGHGLYPFTTQALWTMAQRADPDLAEAFNPRTLQNGVLVPVLDGAAPALEAGEFPPAALLEKLGGFRGLDARARQDLRGRVGPTEEGRMSALLELWDGTGHVVNLPSALLEAFGAPAISNAEPATAGTDAEDDGEAPRPISPIVDTRTREERELESWAKGGRLDRAPDKLRALIYEAIADTIDWDGLALERTRFTATEDARPFRRRSVAFTRQGTRSLPSLVMLEIPGADAPPEVFDRVAIALSGALRAEREGHWNFPGGTDAFGLFLTCLSEWRDDVVRQLQALTSPRPDWDHAAAAAELLVIGCAINGRIKVDADQTSDVAAIFAADWPADAAPGSPEMQRVYEALSGRQSELRDLLRALCSGSKGGVIGTLVDPAVALAALKRLRSSGWRLEQQPPEDLQVELFKRCADLYKRTAASLAAAATSEREARVAWLAEMEGAFGAKPRREIIADLTATRTAFADANLAGPAARRLDDALEALRGAQFDEAINAARTLRDADDSLSVLPAYARTRSNAVIAGRTVVEAATAFLDKCREQLDDQANRNAAQAQAVQNDIEAIEQALTTIGEALRTEEPADAA